MSRRSGRILTYFKFVLLVLAQAMDCESHTVSHCSLRWYSAQEKYLLDVYHYQREVSGIGVILNKQTTKCSAY